MKKRKIKLMLKSLALSIVLFIAAVVLLFFFFNTCLLMEPRFLLILLSFGITIYAIWIYARKFAPRVSGIVNSLCLVVIMVMMIQTFFLTARIYYQKLIIKKIKKSPRTIRRAFLFIYLIFNPPPLTLHPMCANLYKILKLKKT